MAETLTTHCSDILKTIRTKTEAYRIELPCEEEDCDGMVESTGSMALTSFPEQYLHKCTKCSAGRFVSGITYPHVEWSR